MKYLHEIFDKYIRLSAAKNAKAGDADGDDDNLPMAEEVTDPDDDDDVKQELTRSRDAGSHSLDKIFDDAAKPKDQQKENSQQTPQNPPSQFPDLLTTMEELRRYSAKYSDDIAREKQKELGRGRGGIEM